MTTLEAIYENGIFKPISSVPNTLKEHERVRIIIEIETETETDEDLQAEINQWEAASDEDLLKFEKSLGNPLMVRGDVLLLTLSNQTETVMNGDS